MIELELFKPADGAHLDTLVDIWNAACAPDLPVTPRFVEFNARTPGVEQVGCLALRAGRPVGFVLASAVAGTSADTGWVDALAVVPDARRQGAGVALLCWAEAWLEERGCAAARLGGSLRPFAPGLPIELGSEHFFARRGYVLQRHVWDVARRLRHYTSPASARPADVRPLRVGEEPALLAFMTRAFPGRWASECRKILAAGGRRSDYLALWVDGAIEGFCHLTLEDSYNPIERFYPQRLPRPWGQLGPIGVGEACRGQGYGAALLDAGLRYLRDGGVDGCVIDWTDLLDFYARFSFVPYRQYAVLTKKLNSD
jgi:GNAT superfamily N-acetyltransferase